MRYYQIILILALFLGLTARTASAEPYVLASDAKYRVEFHSKATLESFSGKAKGVTATFAIDTTNLGMSTGQIIVDLRTLDTGIGMRNKHMTENHLHTDSFPNATFQLDSVGGASGALPASVRVNGRMTIHGVTKPISAPGTVTRGQAKAGSLRLQTEFPLKITDYGIPRPEFLFLKLAEEVSILVDLTVSPKPQ